MDELSTTSFGFAGFFRGASKIGVDAATCTLQLDLSARGQGRRGTRLVAVKVE